MSNPWSDFEDALPPRDFEPAASGAKEPGSDVFRGEGQTAQALFDSLIQPEPKPTPQQDVYVVREARPSSPFSGMESDRDDSPPRRGRLALVITLGVGALVLCVGATIAGMSLIPKMIANTEAEATAEPSAEPSETTPPPPEAPISALSLDLKEDLAFAADIPAYVSLKNVSIVLDDAAEWTRNDTPGATSYTNASGCTVNWSQKDQDFAAGVTDFEASYEALFAVTKNENFMVSDYGYWTAENTKPAGKTEAVESRVDQDGEAVVVAARAVVETGEVGLIWMTCEDPSKLDRFASDIRYDVGFILDGLKP